MTRKKRICECTTWEPRPHEPCGDSECGECADCDECGGKGFYFITSANAEIDLRPLTPKQRRDLETMERTRELVKK